MYEELLIRHGAPTLAGLKTGSLFTYPYRNRQTLAIALRHLNRRLSPRGLRLLPLRLSAARCLVYLYRPAQLRADLRKPHVQRLLSPLGYPCTNPAGCVTLLRRKVYTATEFPHEIGVFLSYPPADVEGFMRGDHCCYTGCWKVYGNPIAAQQIFAAYHACTKRYLAKYHAGTALEELLHNTQ